MARRILSCVGNRDPFWGSAGGRIVTYRTLESEHSVNSGPILSFLEAVSLDQNDEVVLLFTRPGPEVRTETVNEARATSAAITERFGFPEARIRLESLNQPDLHPEFDPSNHLHALARMRECLAQLPLPVEDVENWVVYSSGTPQMQTAWLLLVSSGLFTSRLFRAEGVEVDILPVFEDQRLREATALFSAGDFRAAQHILRQIQLQGSSSPDARQRRGVVRIFSQLAWSCFLWTRFEYREASRILQKSYSGLQGLKAHLDNERTPLLDELMEIVHSQLNYLEKVADDPGERRTDLFYGAERLYGEGQLVEALWRLDTVCEQSTMQAMRVVRPETEQIDGESEAWRILQEANPGVAIDEQQERLSLRSQRNKTIHAGSAVDRNQVYAALAATRRYADAVGLPLPDASSYPLRKEGLQRISALILEIVSGKL